MTRCAFEPSPGVSEGGVSEEIGTTIHLSSSYPLPFVAVHTHRLGAPEGVETSTYRSSS